MTQQWLEVVVEVARDDAETWADACLDAGALSVQAEDADADSPDERPLFGEPLTPCEPLTRCELVAPGQPVEPGQAASAGIQAAAAAGVPAAAFGWQRTRLTVLLNSAVDPAALVAEVATSLERKAPAVAAIRVVADRDWVRATQAQFEPIPIGQQLIVVPSWHIKQALERQDKRVALIIDPGLAFGTGSHPTTRMCLEWLDQADLAGKRVIDYGCGSGILAIAAARLGAAEVIGIDIDPQALVSARDNAHGNRVQIAVQSSAEAMPAPADIVIVNILSNPLKLLAPMLTSLVAAGGVIVLSGVLERQIEDVAQFYQTSVPVTPWRARDGWVCLTGLRPA